MTQLEQVSFSGRDLSTPNRGANSMQSSSLAANWACCLGGGRMGALIRVFDYMVKPFSPREMLARLGTHLEMARLRREGARRESEMRPGARHGQEHALRKCHNELEERVRQRTRALSLANARLVQRVAWRKQVEGARTTLRRRLVHAQEEEHRRIARELHDDLTQRLAVLALDAATLERFPGCPAGVEEKVHGMREQLVALSDAVHSLSRQLHPSILDELGIVDALHAECQSLGQRDAIAVRFLAHDVATGISREVALCVYRVTQEALRNVARHAKTRRAYVRFFATDQHLVLRVRDRGVGFDLAARGKMGLGLQSMRERARLVQGRLSVKSRRGEGTDVTLRVPLPTSRA
jgi:signal transduction histidine kinase